MRHFIEPNSFSRNEQLALLDLADRMEAKNYVQFLEKQLDHEIQFVSTGAEREKFVLKGAWL